MKSRFTGRARFLSGLFIAGALLLVVRLYFVQIVNGSAYEREALGQYVATSPETEDRGDIFFRKKDGTLVSAAVMQTGWRIAIQPKVLTDPQAVYAQINAILPVDKEQFFASAAKKGDPYEEIALRVSDSTATAVRRLKIPGVIFVQDQWRYYPARELAAQTLGFVGFQGTSTVKVGVYGLEKSWQDKLSLTRSGLYVNPFAEIFTNLEAVVSNNPASHGDSLVTSIEPSVQQQLEATLDDVMKTYTAKGAGGIIMNPHTGEIYAIGARPAFDPNTYGTVTNPAVFSNPLVSGRYELGSIMKPLTMAAAIDSGAVTAETTYDDTGCITVSTYKICNFDLKARGVVPMQEILNQSLNMGASFLATKTGYPVFTKYMKSFGLGVKTGIDLPNEVAGDVSPLGNGTLSAINYDTAAFGQGIAVSPVAMIRALSALANGGVLPNPHVVSAIRYKSGILRSVDAGQGPRVLTATTTREVTDMLVTVFDKALLDGKLKQDHYSIAAKTGTAQIPKTGGGYIEGDVYLHSFFGYFPAYDPKFIVFLFTIQPQGQRYASATLAHPFLGIAKFLINYYNLPPDR